MFFHVPLAVFLTYFFFLLKKITLFVQALAGQSCTLNSQYNIENEAFTAPFFFNLEFYVLLTREGVSNNNNNNNNNNNSNRIFIQDNPSV